MKNIVYEVTNYFTGNAKIIEEGVVTTCPFETIAKIRNYLIGIGINPAIVNSNEEWIIIGDI